MITRLTLEDFERIDEINWHGHIYKSTYNHNYYYNQKNDILVLETCDDIDAYFYYQIVWLEFLFEQKEMYIGCSEYEGIFEMKTPDDCLFGESSYKVTDDNMHIVSLDNNFYLT